MNWRGWALGIIISVTAIGTMIISPMIDDYHDTEMIKIFNNFEDTASSNDANELFDEFIKPTTEQKIGGGLVGKYLNSKPTKDEPSNGLPKQRYEIKCDRGFLMVRNRGSPFFLPNQYVRKINRRCWIT